MSLTYSKDAKIKGFVGVPDQFKIFGEDNTFADEVIATPQQRVNEINSMANNCRWNTQPIFANETQFLPVDKNIMVDSAKMVVAVQPAAVKPEPPKKAEDDDKTLVNALLLGVGVFVIYKLFS
jgi:hypothetical protein